jgi:multidrug resistance efflux pump
MDIDYDADMDRFYIPVNSRYEVQTKGKGSSFRIANTETHERMLVADKHLHEMLEDMARGTNSELGQKQAEIESLRAQLAECQKDAERYRYLKTDTVMQFDFCHTYGMNEVDAAIDQAMSEKG